MPSSTDVRKWLRENPAEGEDIPERGPLPKSLQERYDQAHPDYDSGVTAADFPDVPDDTGTEPAEPPAGERKPKRVRAQGAGSGWQDRLWGRGKVKAPKGPKPKRVPLTDFVEDVYSDLSVIFGDMGMIPMQRCLQFQAPYAGVIAEQQIKGTVVDAAMQPLARAQGALAAVNGLFGTPVFTAGIMLAGGREERDVPVVDQDGAPVTDAEGNQAYRKVLDFDSRTKFMFAAHRYCLLQMTKVTAKDLAQIQERADDMMKRAKEVAKVQAWMFGLPEPADDADPSAEEEAIERAKRMMGGQ